MAKKTQAVTPSSIDVGEAKLAFDAQVAQLEALSRDEVMSPRVDLQLTSAIAYSVAMRDLEAPRRARLAALGAVFDIQLLDGLPRRALAALHARRMQSQAMDAATSARVPEPTLREAQATRGRMMRVLGYYFDEHPSIGRKLVAIRAGTGYLDLANDLLAVAELYEEGEVKALISADPKHYRADDPKFARAMAQELFRGLGLGSDGDASRWTDYAQRAWTLLSRDYDTLAAAGQLVFRNEEDVSVTYPSLISSVRATATRASNGGGEVVQPSPAAAPTATH